MNIENLRKEFPILTQTVYGKPLVYLDNAATAQRPRSVVDKWSEISLQYNSNLHRAVHHLSAVATEEYESTRIAVQKFIGAASPREIIFTSGATASINLAAYSFGEAFIHEGDEIIIAESEHHSNIVPWQQLCSRKGAKIKVLHVSDSGELQVDQLSELLNERTKLLAVAHISNVLGVVNPIEEIVKICHSVGCRVLIDGTQGIVHRKVDVRQIDCDFYLASAHKMYAAPGVGFLYAKEGLLESMPPFMCGGEMIGTVSWEKTTFAPLPQKFEAGTQNIAGVPCLRPAMELMEEMRSPEIESEYLQIRDFMLEELTRNPLIKLYGCPENRENKIPLFSFSVEHSHHEDLALILDKMGIAVRSGQMCAEPLMLRFGVSGMLRASFAPYNTMQEAEYFIKSLERAIKMLQ